MTTVVVATPTTPVSNLAAGYGSEICRLVAEVLENEMEIVVDLEPVLDGDGFPRNIDVREGQQDLTDPYWYIVWTARTSIGLTAGNPDTYYRRKAYDITLTGIRKLDNVGKSNYSEWGDYVELVCDWLEANGTLQNKIKKMEPANITSIATLEHKTENFRYQTATIEFTAMVGDRVRRGA